jgi:hypothetical protein
MQVEQNQVRTNAPVFTCCTNEVKRLLTVYRNLNLDAATLRLKRPAQQEHVRCIIFNDQYSRWRHDGVSIREAYHSL